MRQIVNQAYKEIFTTDKRYIILMGGRGAGRSTVASQYAISKLIDPEYFRCAIMRYVLGDIRNSIYREIIDRADENEVKDSIDIVDNQMVLSYGANTINAVGFKKSSGEQKAKLKSLANYTHIIIEEADEISLEDFTQLDDSLRTIKADIKVILLLNPPPKTHWIVQKWFDLEKTDVPNFYKPKLKESINNTLTINTSYKDNIKNIDNETVIRYEGYKNTNPSHYYNMICGYIPETVIGKVYDNWQIIDEIPHEAYLTGYGLDFGYTNDPTAIVAVYKYNGGFILDEITYQKGLLNSQIADIFKNLPKALIIADSAEPKSIDEIKLYGLSVLPCEKGADSLRNGISLVQQQRISVTRKSKNIMKEEGEYSWIIDRDGNILNEPQGGLDHALDAIRYKISSLLKVSQAPVRTQHYDLYGSRTFF